MGKNTSKSIQDFTLQNVIGEGAFATVYKAVEKSTGKIFAIKQLSKKQLMKEKKIEHAKQEARILEKLSRYSHLIAKLYYHFEDSHNFCNLKIHLFHWYCFNVMHRLCLGVCIWRRFFKCYKKRKIIRK